MPIYYLSEAGYCPPQIVQFWFFCHVSTPRPPLVQYSSNPRPPADPCQTILLTHSILQVTIFQNENYGIEVHSKPFTGHFSLENFHTGQNITKHANVTQMIGDMKYEIWGFRSWYWNVQKNVPVSKLANMAKLNILKTVHKEQNVWHTFCWVVLSQITSEHVVTHN